MELSSPLLGAHSCHTFNKNFQQRWAWLQGWTVQVLAFRQFSAVNSTPQFGQ
jgi:hypothetical protein